MNIPNNNITKPESLMRHGWLGFVIAGALFALVFKSAESDLMERYAVIGALSLLVGLLANVVVNLVRVANCEIRTAGRVLRSTESHTGRITRFLVDNVWLAENETVRRALLPTDDELAGIPFSLSLIEQLREIREGLSWLIKGGVARGGPSLRVDPKVRFFQWYRNRLIALQRENFDLKVKNQRLARMFNELGPGNNGVETVREQVRVGGVVVRDRAILEHPVMQSAGLDNNGDSNDDKPQEAAIVQ